MLEGFCSRGKCAGGAELQEHSRHSLLRGTWAQRIRFCVRFKGEHVDVSLIASEGVVVFRLGKQVSWQEATDSVSM